MLFSSFLLTAILGLIRGQEDEAVFTLTTENFDTFIKENEAVLVKFYAPWCGHCKALAPEYEKAAQAIALDEDLSPKLAKVDATIERDLAERFGVKGFPTLKYFTGDSDAPFDYSGGRSEDTIVQWLRTRSMPAVTMLETAEEAIAFQTKAPIVLIGFFESDGEAAQALVQVAEASRELAVVGQVSSADVKVEGTEFGKLYLFRDFGDDEDKMVEYDGDLTFEAMTEFMNAERYPLIAAITVENYKDYVDRGLPFVWISVMEDQADDAVAKLMPYAMEAKGKLSFTWVDAEKYKQHIDNLGITETPGLMINEESTKYLFDGEFNEENLKAFFEGYAAGTLTAHLKSEPVPTSNEEPVFVLVGSEFDKVIGQDKDVFVEFYAPWCGHCKALAPEYEKVGEAFSDVESVVIAKIDATQNDTPADIQGFPTLLFYPKGETTAVTYSGDRKQEAMIEWIKEHATGDMSAVKTEL